MENTITADGIYGIVNSEFGCEQALATGRAVAAALKNEGIARPTVVIGKDTRISSAMLESAMCAGLCSAGADVLLLGVIPTPAVSYLTDKYGADAGIMITGGSRSYEWNGWRIFGANGCPASAALTQALEGDISVSPVIGDAVGRVLPPRPAVDDYVFHLLDTVNISLRGLRIAVDCANGCGCTTARKLFSALEADCVFVNDQPNGTNIHEYGQMEDLTELVKKMHFSGGVSFDADGSCCVAVDEKGNLLDGDKILAALAYVEKDRMDLSASGVVLTAHSNLGLVRFCEANGISAVVTDQEGDGVVREMLHRGCPLGGEPCGRLVMTGAIPSADGQLTAMRLLTAARENGWKLSRMGALMERYPQVMVTVRADEEQKRRFSSASALQKEIERANADLGRDGRVLVEPSVAEPLICVTVEGKEFDQVNALALVLADRIKTVLGTAAQE